MKVIESRRALALLLAACIVKLWLLPLPSGFWVDEMVTAFVVHHGADHPSLKVAPQVAATNYYALPALAEQWFGFSEVAYRAPSLLLMGAALFFLARIAARCVHPDAGWFVVFAAMTLRGFNYAAADARPYALAIALALAATWFLTRWLDTGGWLWALGFATCAAVLWRAHLIAFPFYLLFGLYAWIRVRRGESAVSWPRLGAVSVAVLAALVPVGFDAAEIYREADAHVVAEKPRFGVLVNALKLGLVGGAGIGSWIAGGWILDKRFRAAPEQTPAVSTIALLGGWWLVHPLALFAFSWFGGNSVFVPRYLSIALPGAALAATLAASVSWPARLWRPAAFFFGGIALLVTGSMGATLAEHHNSRWREASQAIRELGLAESTPVLYPSPFIEAKYPRWRPDLTLPAFLYCHLETYPVGGTPYLLPFEMSPEAEEYAAHLAVSKLSQQERFVIYGGDSNAHDWQLFFQGQAALAGWKSERLGPFGDVDVVVFSRPELKTPRAK